MIMVGFGPEFQNGRRQAIFCMKGPNHGHGLNHQVVLATRPHGEPKETDLRLVETPVPEPGPGQMLLRTLYLSLDPYMRGRMNAGPSYVAATEIGEVMGGGTVCRVRGVST